MVDYGGFLKGMIDSSGYHCYLVRINGKSKFLRTNRLVAEYFVENPNNLEIVNHKDKNKLNNDYRNLEWVSYSDNIKDYYLKTPERKISKAIYVEKLDNEIWVDIKDFDKYQVSNLGRILKIMLYLIYKRLHLQKILKDKKDFKNKVQRLVIIT